MTIGMPEGDRAQRGDLTQSLLIRHTLGSVSGYLVMPLEITAVGRGLRKGRKRWRRQDMQAPLAECLQRSGVSSLGQVKDVNAQQLFNIWVTRD